MKKRKCRILASCLAFVLGLVTISSTVLAETNDFHRGTVDGSVYTNDSIGLQCNLSDTGYTILDEKELAQLMNLTSDSITDEDASKLLEEGKDLIDFYAVNYNTGSTINMSVKGIGVAEARDYFVLSEQEIVDSILKEYKDTGIDQTLFSGLGLENGDMRADTITFLGKEAPCILITGDKDINGQTIQMYERMVIYKGGLAYSIITVCSFMEDDNQKALDCFSEI